MTTEETRGTGHWLRLGQHALLGFLALVCGARAVADGAHPLAELAALAAFIGWYAHGPRVARTGRGGTPWFVGLVLLWAVLVLVSPENVWLAFPLWLLAGHVLPLLPAVLVSLAVFVVVALEPVRQTGEASYPAIIGPLIGMVVALGIAKAQQALVRDGIAQGFSSILLLARAARAEQDPARVREILEHVESGAAQGLEESRRVVGALAPTDLDEGSLTGAVRRVTERFAEESGVVARVVVAAPLSPCRPGPR